MPKDKRVLIISPENKGNEAFSAGRALQARLGSQEGIEAFHLGIAPLDEGAQEQIWGLSTDAFIWSKPALKNFYEESMDMEKTAAILENFITRLRPGHAHLNFGSHVGYDLAAILRRLAPKMLISATLRDFLPICAANGSLLGKSHGSACGVLDCPKCLPTYTANDFWLRKRRLAYYLEQCDALITPACHMQDAYLEWGLSPEKLFIAEDCQPDLKPRPEHVSDTERNPACYGFFGDISPLSGIQVVLHALEGISADKRKKMKFVVCGCGLERQPVEFQKEINQLRTKFEGEGILTWLPWPPVGGIEKLLADVDWVLAPALAQSAPPFILHAAALCGRPVIASKNGVFPEKITHDFDGWLVEPGNVVKWNETIKLLLENRNLWTRLRNNISRQNPNSRNILDHMRIMGLVEDTWA